MIDKVQKIRKEVEKLKSNLMYGACSSQVAMETRCKEEAYNEVLSIMDSMQEESQVCMYSTANYTNADRLTLCKDCKELCQYNQKTAAESLCISQEAYDEIVDKCLYGSEVELVDGGDLPKEEPVSEDLESFVRNYREKYWYPDDIDKFIGFAKQVANWQKQQLMAKAVDGKLYSTISGSEQNVVAYVGYGEYGKDGDQVKLIIINEN